MLIGEVCIYSFSFLQTRPFFFFGGGGEDEKRFWKHGRFWLLRLKVSYHRMRGVWNGRLEHLQCCLGRCTSTQHQVQTSKGRVEFFFPCETD